MKRDAIKIIMALMPNIEIHVLDVVKVRYGGRLEWHWIENQQYNNILLSGFDNLFFSLF